MDACLKILWMLTPYPKCRRPRTKVLLLVLLCFTLMGYLLFVCFMPVLSDDTSRLILHGARLPSNRSLMFEEPLDVPRVAQYCNLPTTVKLAEEGEAPEDYVLSAVYVLIRHGDRTPMTTYMGIPRPSPKQGCTMDSDALHSIPQAQNFLSDLDAQKEKQPAWNDFAHWSLYPQHKDCTSSQLTGTGALQHLLNGLSLREKYVKKWNLFGQTFSPSLQLDLRSTRLSRTYQSAVALLYTFLPRFNISELNIRAVRSSMFCSPDVVPSSCCYSLPKLRQEADKGSRSKERGSRNSDWIPAMQPLAEVFGVKEGRLPWPTALVDILQGHACHSLPLPCGPSGKCVTATMMDKLWKLVVSDARSYNKDPQFDRYSRTIIHSLLKDILNSMLRVVHGQSRVKFTLFSGHDLTVSPLLQALGVHDGVWPHYATRVVFELYKKAGEQGKNYVRVLHNGRDITPNVRFCKAKIQNGMCSFKFFKYFVERDNMEVIGVNSRQSLDSFCKSML